MLTRTSRLTWRNACAAIALLALALALPAAVAAPAGAETPQDAIARRKAGPHSTPPDAPGPSSKPSWEAATSVGDVSGDNGPGFDPRGDLNAAAAAYDNGSITLGASVVNPEAPTSANWSCCTTAVLWDLDTNGDGTVDYSVIFANANGVYSAVERESDQKTVCPATPTYNGNAYFSTFSASCIGSPPSFRFKAFFAYTTASGVNSTDAAPNSGFSSSVVASNSSSSGSTNQEGNHAPRGALDRVERAPGALRVVGWAWDPDDSVVTSNQIHIYLDNKAVYAGAANLERPDVARVYPAAGSTRGFDVTVPLNAPVATRVCVYSIDNAGGTNTTLGCRAISTSPFGVLDPLEGGSGIARVRGWTIDPDTSSPVPVRVYVDAVFARETTADGDRPDVGGRWPAYGSAHGFDVTLPMGRGTHRVCAYALDIVNGAHPTTLGCRSVTVA